MDRNIGGLDTMPEALTKEVITALDTPVKIKKPFFLYFALYGIHTPLMANERFIKPYREMGLEETEASYASMIESMDEALGKVLDYLEANQLEENTVILFMSDNGGLSAVARGGEKHYHNRPLNSGKGSIYEGGIRVPMLAYWHNKIKPNSVNTTPIIIEDFFPSLLDMAQINETEIPQIIDGQSFVPQLLNDGIESAPRPLFWHYPNEWGPEGPGIGSCSAVRLGDWKLIYFHTDLSLELYNLKDDLQEINNLLYSNHKKALELTKILTTHLQSVEAQMPTNKIMGKVIPWPNSQLVSK